MINKLTQRRNLNTRALKVSPWSSGFTLIETLVAVLLLTTAIAGPLTIASKSLIAALVAKDQVTAFFLAQDAVEYVRFIRDTNKLRGNNWLAGLDGTSNGFTTADGTSGDCVGANGCYFDSTGNNLDAPYNIAYCQNNNCLTLGGLPSGSGTKPIRFNTTLNRFTYVASGSIVTPFIRSVKIVEVVNEQEAVVTVAVYWGTAGATGGATGAGCPTGARCVVVQESIFNWQ